MRTDNYRTVVFMHLLKLDKLQLHYGEQIIFDEVQFNLNRGDRLCIVGRNGVGKSTLLKTIEGEVEPDGGSVWCEQSTKIASLAQSLPEANEVNVYDFVARGLAQLGDDLAAFHELSHRADEQSLEALGRIQQRIEAADGWRVNSKIEKVLTQLELDGETQLKDLSGGWRRRVALARALVTEPDILLLDEPTNHLDVVSIEWLESELLDFKGAIIFITHDRAFLRRVANRIGELDRGKLSVWDGDYASFLEFRERQLAEEERHNALFDKKLAQEEAWIRQGIKARRTRNEGRVRALKKMRDERSARIDQLKTARMELASESSSGKLVAEFKDVSFGFENKPIINNFSGLVLRGDKIGLIGPNGIGKSTFLKLLVGDLQPNSGTVKLGTKLETAYFDQLQEQIDLEKSPVDNIAEGREYIEINGQNKHIMGYLGDFLFSGERARTPVKALSGGERNRVLLAKLFSKSANLLIMDEPTNDLDVETLELLEEILTNYSGTLLLVSHDREFLDNVVSSTIGFEGQGVLKEYVGGYRDWVRQGGHWPETGSNNANSTDQNKPASVQGAAQTPPKAEATAAKPEAKPAKKLSYKLQRELDGLPQKIEKLEEEIEAMTLSISDPAFYQQDQAIVTEKTALLAQKEQELADAYERWETLENS